jgi:hypothetical protein
MRSPKLDGSWAVTIAGAILVFLVASCGTAQPQATEATMPAPTTETLLSPVPTEEDAFTSPISPTAATEELVVEAGLGGVQGVIASQPPEWASQQIFAYFAPFTPSGEDGAGIYVLETSSHPNIAVGPDGVFQLGSVPPGSYVLVVGPTPEEARVLADGDRPRVIEITEGAVLDLGKIYLGR